jgi:hypothetical protein
MIESLVNEEAHTGDVLVSEARVAEVESVLGWVVRCFYEWVPPRFLNSENVEVQHSLISEQGGHHDVTRLPNVVL